jgi:hypothetical protein
MPAVMPSQAVATIGELFPGARGPSQATYTSGNANALRGIVDIVRQVPPELLVLAADQYAELVIGLGAIEQQLGIWTSRSDVGVLQPVKGFDVLHLLWRALRQCPDEFPPPSTADLAFISDTKLRWSIGQDIGAATRALQNHEWKPATVLAGATIEALLHWKLDEPPYPAQRAAAGKAAAAAGKLDAPPPRDFDRWALQQFIEVAGALNVLKPDTVKAADLARDFRNLIHPGAAARKAATCDRATAYSAVAGMENVIRDLTPDSTE